AGRLCMVANRHLPYEAALARHFAQVTETGGDARFKIIEASGARRGTRRMQGKRG
ncbi:MAG: methyltransferase, partial [Paracoccus sp. (in: a-proteobacteria)]